MEMDHDPSMVSIDRQSSIEKEPLTLNINQIDFAREAALYVVNTRSFEEALTIFTQGLAPVVRCPGDDSDMSMEGGNEDGVNRNDKDATIPPEMMRDIVSAPF